MMFCEKFLLDNLCRDISKLINETKFIVITKKNLEAIYLKRKCIFDSYKNSVSKDLIKIIDDYDNNLEICINNGNYIINKYGYKALTINGNYKQIYLNNKDIKEEKKEMRFLKETFNTKLEEYKKNIPTDFNFSKVYNDIKGIFIECCNMCYFDLDMFNEVKDYDVELKITQEVIYHIKYDNVYREVKKLEPLSCPQTIEDDGLRILNNFINDLENNNYVNSYPREYE